MQWRHDRQAVVIPSEHIHSEAGSLASKYLGLLLLAIIMFLVAGHAFALDPDKQFHDYVKDEWSIEEGLPQITVLAIEQDEEGYIWAGTQAGLARFDGVRFVAFSPDNTPELPGLFIHDLFVDGEQRMWISSYKGLAVYENRQFRRIPVMDSEGRETAIDIRMTRELPDGRIVAAAVEGLFVVEDGRLSPMANDLEGHKTFSLLSTRNGFFIGGDGVVFRWKNGEMTSMPLPDGDGTALVADLEFVDGTLWAGTSHGLLRREGDHWQRFEGNDSLATQPIDVMFVDRSDTIWVGTHQGLGRLHGQSLVEFIDDGDPVAHRNLRSIFEDREGNLWLGSQWEGIARLWNGWTQRFSAGDGLHDPVIWSLTPDSHGGLWVGTNRGLSHFDGERFKLVIPEEKLPHPNAYTLFDDGERLWVGTRTGLVWYEDGRAWTPGIFAPLSTTQVSGIIEDRHGNAWIASFNGLYRYSEKDGVAALIRYGEDQGLEEIRTRLLLETSAGEIYLGTQNGLFRVNGSRMEKVGVHTGLKPGIDITALSELDDGSLVIGTLTEQVFLRSGDQWTEITADDGLPVNSPFFITDDSDGFLWAAGIRGLFRVPVEDLHDFSEGRIDKVRGEMLLSERGDIRGSQKAYCCNGAGNAKGFIDRQTLWLPTRDGVVTVDTQGIVRNSVVPLVAVERVRFGGKWHEYRPGNRFHVPPGSRDLTFEFTTLSFQQPNSVQMRYRLRGYDKKWQMLEDSDHRSVAYTNLPPGDYDFEVSGSNNAGVWTEEPTVMGLVIEPRFHETNWFRLLVAGTFLLFLYGGHRYQVRHLHARREELERAVSKQTEELRVANETLQEISVTDPLTGLRNRRYLQGQLPIDLAFYDREARKPGGENLITLFALADIDHFKRINDKFGHHAGDLVLEQFSRLLKELVRTGDYVVRWGGEEFLIVFRPMASEMAEVIAERMRTAIEECRFTIENGRELRLTGSIGVVEYPLFQDDRGPLGWEDVVELADHALYHVKTHGRNGWGVLRPTSTTDMETIVNEARSDFAGLLSGGKVQLVEQVMGDE